MSKTRAKHNVGVIGLGSRAEGFVRQLYAGMPRARLVALCETDEERLRQFCQYCGVTGVATCTDPDAFFARDEMDAVVITTPDFTHAEMGLRAIAAGKHFYLEKPMDVTAERCRALLRAHRASRVRAFVGFNMRVIPCYARAKAIIDSGVLGPLVHVAGLEQLDVAHSASFMRRYHRHRARSGGFLNTKSCHDLDFMNWCVGHQHKVVRVASFGGLNVFTPDKAPARRCRECPPGVHQACRYKDKAGYVFPIGAKEPLHKTRQADVYGGDLCVYTDDKSIVDNQTLILEWDHGVRGNFNLELFQARERRTTQIWGEDGVLELDGETIRVVRSPGGEVLEERPVAADGAHGGADPYMLDRFFDAIEGTQEPESGLQAGLAATLVALKAEEALLTRKVVEISPEEYE
jgi:predicted dehydrogenase